MNNLMRSLVISLIIVFVTACGGGGGTVEGDDSSITLRYSNPNIQIGGTPDHLIAITTETESSESLSVIGEIDENGDPTSISGIVFTAADGSYSEVRIGEDGRPITYREGNGYTIEFSNYTSTSVDISVYDQHNLLVEGPTTLDDSSDFIATIINNPLTLGAQANGAIMSGAISNDALWSALLKPAATIVSATSCGVDFLIAFYGRKIKYVSNAALSCLSAVSSVIGLLTNSTTAQKFSFAVDSLQCTADASFLSCTAVAASTMAYGFNSNFTILIPQGLKTLPRDSMVSLSWLPVPDASSYNIFYKKVGDAEYQVINGITSHSYVHSNLDYGFTYEYKIQGVRSDGVLTNFSAIKTARPYPTLPPKPQNVSILNIDQNKISIIWDKVPNAKEYYVFKRKDLPQGESEYGWGVPQLVKVNDYGTKMATLIHNLSSGTQYHFAVKAIVDGIRGDFSNIVTATTLAVPPPISSGPPTASFYLSNYIDEQKNLRVVWYGTSPEATGYNLYWGTTTGQSPEFHQNKLLVDNMYQLGHIFDMNDFIPGTEYFFAVTAVNESGEGPISNEVSRIIDSPSVIDAPYLLQPIPGDGEVTLAWDSVTGAERYDVYWGTTSGQSPANHSNWLSDASSPVTIPNLINGTNYYFTVSATMGGTESSASTERIGVPTAPPTPPIDSSEICITDNITGLMWEQKTNDGGLRDRTWSYMNTTNMNGVDPRSNYDWGKCLASSSDTDGIYCHTQGYVSAVNSTELCGFNDWRMPTLAELETIVVADKIPAIDLILFPYTNDTPDPFYPHHWWYWSSTPAGDSAAHYMYFELGIPSAFGLNRQNSARVRLVRSVQ